MEARAPGWLSWRAAHPAHSYLHAGLNPCFGWGACRGTDVDERLAGGIRRGDPWRPVRAGKDYASTGMPKRLDRVKPALFLIDSILGRGEVLPSCRLCWPGMKQGRWTG